MERRILSIAGIFIALFLINNFTASQFKPQEDATELINKEWQHVGDVQMKHSYYTFKTHFSWNKFVTHTLFLDKRIKAKNKNQQIQLSDLYEDGEDKNVPALSKDNILNLIDAVYSHKEKSSGIYTSPDEEGYYKRAMHIEFTESLPLAVKRMFSNHYMYLQTNSGQLIACKLNIMPLDSVLINLILILFAFGLFFYVALNGINFLWGHLIGSLYAFLLYALDFIPLIFPIIFVVMLFSALYIGSKLKMWSITRKIFSPRIIVAGVALYLALIAYLYFVDGRLQELLVVEKYSTIVILLIFSILISAFIVFDFVRLYRLLTLLCVNTKVPITGLKVNSSFMKTYRRGLPDYFISVIINDQYDYADISCTRKIYTENKVAHKVSCKTLYYNKYGDVIIL